jgi:hypothetical protein
MSLELLSGATTSGTASSTAISSSTSTQAARPDIFQLHVDERPKQPVTTHVSDETLAKVPQDRLDRHPSPSLAPKRLSS